MSVFVQKVAIDFGEKYLRLYFADTREFTEERQADLFLLFQRSRFQLRKKKNQPRAFSSVYFRGKIIDEVMIADYLRFVLSRAGIGRFVFARIELMFALSPSVSPATKLLWNRACDRIGISSVIFVSSPVAAAVGAGFDFPIPTVALLIHLGESESSVSAVSLTHSLFHLSLSFCGNTLRERVRSIRCMQSQETLTESDWEHIQMQVGKILTESDQAKTHADAIVLLVREFGEGMIADIQAALEKLSIEELSLCSTQGIVLTGGFASQQGVAQFLSRRLGVPVYAATDPTHVVIHGTAKLLHQLERDEIA